MDSILTSIKKLVGIDSDDESFDNDLIIHINSVLFVLAQLGVGPVAGFSITGSEETWSDFIPNVTNLEAIKSYVYLKVKLLFDPPMNGALMESIKEQIKEYEVRIYITAEDNLREEENQNA